mgnify:CR=1 FL=1
MAQTHPLNGKLVAVIGGSGFLGDHVAQALLSHGARVRIASRNPALRVALVVPETGSQDGKAVPGRSADVRVHIAPLPERWLNAEEMKQDMGALHQSRSRDCSQWLQP